MIRNAVQDALNQQSMGRLDERIISEIYALQKGLGTVTDMFHFMAQSISALIPTADGARVSY